MERYIWTINGRTHDELEPLHVDHGERVRITFVNESMMAHPMHLHGMFMQLENGQSPERQPNKHTIIIPPGKSRSVLLTANEPGEWAFHCHLLFHMLSGMMTTMVVDKAPDHRTLMHEHEHFHSLKLETDAGIGRDGFVSSWDLDGWAGSDKEKLSLKAEGELIDGATDQSEFWAMYSRNISEFWDAQLGLRYDIDPTSRGYVVGGFEGLAKYFFETELHFFLSDQGNFSGRLHVENNILLTQQLVSQPYVELNFFAQDEEDEVVGAGLSHLELGIQTRYEFTRKFAPYLDLRYEQKVGETSFLANQQGDNVYDLIATVGLRISF